jgi:mono/diheme cytochrome c family protein
MKLHTLLIVGFALSTAGCAEKQQAVPEAVTEVPAPPPATEAPAAKTEAWMNDAFLEHMHRHADELDDLNLALADGDLDAAIASANWLSRHDAVTNIPPEWQLYLDGMREAARAVAEASDVEAARGPAERITDNCQGCHRAAGMH